MCINRSSKSQGRRTRRPTAITVYAACRNPHVTRADPSGGSSLHRSPAHLSSCTTLTTLFFATLFWLQQHKSRVYQVQEQAAHTRCLHGPDVRHPRSPRNTPLQWLPRPGSGDRLNGQQFLQCFWRQAPGPTVGPKKGKNRRKISKQSKDKKTA